MGPVMLNARSIVLLKPADIVSPSPHSSHSQCIPGVLHQDCSLHAGLSAGYETQDASWGTLPLWDPENPPQLGRHGLSRRSVSG